MKLLAPLSLFILIGLACFYLLAFIRERKHKKQEKRGDFLLPRKEKFNVIDITAREINEIESEIYPISFDIDTIPVDINNYTIHQAAKKTGKEQTAYIMGLYRWDITNKTYKYYTRLLIHLPGHHEQNLLIYPNSISKYLKTLNGPNKNTQDNDEESLTIIPLYGEIISINKTKEINMLLKTEIMDFLGENLDYIYIGKDFISITVEEIKNNEKLEQLLEVGRKITHLLKEECIYKVSLLESLNSSV